MTFWGGGREEIDHETFQPAKGKNSKLKREGRHYVYNKFETETKIMPRGNLHHNVAMILASLMAQKLSTQSVWQKPKAVL